MTRLPSVLGPADLPLAELCAARLDGEVMGFLGGFVPIDEPDLPSLRAQALALDAEPDLIIDRASAAWVHGAVEVPPARTTFCIDATARTTARLDRGRVREVRLAAEDVVGFGRARCTSRARTAYDLVRDPAIDDRTVVATVAALVTGRTRMLADLHARLDAAHRLPHKQLAFGRLAAVAAQR
ncbi:hypothetical protein [Agromyces sp. LHK192]|uniref:hypothetical protein n=1 Tax=Agromyces sp. LHK192 TaxID=2498704 RepID=UPI000FD8A6B6|nr:hypothetical protein [Agromyces sp. LHK192]